MPQQNHIENLENLENLIAATTKQLLQLRALHRSLHRPVAEDVLALRSMADRHGFEVRIEPNHERSNRDRLELISDDHGEFWWRPERIGLEPKSDPFVDDDRRDYLDTATQGSPLHRVIREVLESLPKEFPWWEEGRWPFAAQVSNFEREDDNDVLLGPWPDH